MNIPNLSFQQYAEFNGGVLPASIRWQFAQSHDDRFKIVEEVLDDCYRRLVDGRKTNRDHSEDAMTQHVVDMMSSAGIPAEHDPEIGGHVDIVVRAHHGFLFVVEAKKHTSYNWLSDGFRQLATRYGVAQPGRDRGEILIYCRRRDGNKVLDLWRQRLLRDFGYVEVTEPDDGNGRLFFRTKHVCRSSGCHFYVRHKLVPLYHKPEK
ncbi:hypothetical protein KUV57_10725 [Epibacterium sp. DP7N7-1]|nr:hypothetical protein [Epibacterium sp. DP7N7-1]